MFGCRNRKKCLLDVSCGTQPNCSFSPIILVLFTLLRSQRLVHFRLQKQEESLTRCVACIGIHLCIQSRRNPSSPVPVCWERIAAGRGAEPGTQPGRWWVVRRGHAGSHFKHRRRRWTAVAGQPASGLWFAFEHYWHLSICAFEHLSIWALVHLSICAFEHLRICACAFVHLSIWAFAHWCICAFVHLCIWAFEHLCICAF